MLCICFASVVHGPSRADFILNEYGKACSSCCRCKRKYCCYKADKKNLQPVVGNKLELLHDRNIRRQKKESHVFLQPCSCIRNELRLEQTCAQQSKKNDHCRNTARKSKRKNSRDCVACKTDAKNNGELDEYFHTPMIAKRIRV